MTWWHKNLQTRYTMADITPTSSTPKDPKKQSRALRGINEVFKLVIMLVLLHVTTTHFFSFFREHPNNASPTPDIIS